jgi:hypothetical protein
MEAPLFSNRAIRFAIRLLDYHCSKCTFMPSVALHVAEFTF